ncbi:RICIN domain-containing protein [Kribbella sp. NPDC003505]|uniref:RICIN domain-containing protein n=1 Tax=Kribbella sp. NPDC003505 TaxID=3154448 RepID=UPI0033AED7C7
MAAVAMAATGMSALSPVTEARAGAVHVQSVPEGSLIENKESNMELVPFGAENGAPVKQSIYNPTTHDPSFSWSFVKKVDAPGEDSDRYWLVNPWSGRCAGVSGGALYDGAPVILWDCNQDAWVNYWFIRVDWYENGLPVYRMVNVWSGKCLAIPDGSGQIVQAIQWSCANDPDQQWWLT